MPPTFWWVVSDNLDARIHPRCTSGTSSQTFEILKNCCQGCSDNGSHYHWHRNDNVFSILSVAPLCKSSPFLLISVTRIVVGHAALQTQQKSRFFSTVELTRGRTPVQKVRMSRIMSSPVAPGHTRSIAQLNLCFGNDKRVSSGSAMTSD